MRTKRHGEMSSGSSSSGTLWSIYVFWLICCMVCYGYNLAFLFDVNNIRSVMMNAVIPLVLQLVCYGCTALSVKFGRFRMYVIFITLSLSIPAVMLYMIQAAELALLLPITYAALGLIKIGSEKVQKADIVCILAVTLFIKIVRWAVWIRNPGVVGSVFLELVIFCFIIIGMMYIFYWNMQAAKTVKDLYEEAREAANVDGLTGLLNRKGMSSHIMACQKKATVFSVIMMDIDNFKHVNDTYGHTFGDRVLKGLADTLTDNIRCTDKVFRYGGEEFIIVCSGTNREQALIVAEKVRKAFKALLFEYDNEELHFTISLGVAECTYKQYKDVESLINVADENLYEAKHTGKNRVVG